MPRAVLFAVLLCLGAGGCLTLDEDNQLGTVSHNPFEIFTPAKGMGKVNYTPAAQEVALRVDFVGRKIVAENQDIGLRPLFATIGTAKEELFHQDTRIVYITEGLVKRCKDEAELAALLSFELGKMVAEREALASPVTRKPDARPPIFMPVGNAGQFNGQDQTAVAELGNYEKDNPKRTVTPTRPNPQHLARNYLEKAGYTRTDLDRVDQLLQIADRNCELERQLKGLPPQSNWVQ